MSDKIVLESVEDDLKRIQGFDAQQLVQREKLGEAFAFDDAVNPANRVIALYQKMPVSALREFPPSQLNTIQEQCKSVYNLFDQILSFNSRSADAEAQQTKLMEDLQSAYQTNFNKMYPFISFAVARTVDFSSLEIDGRAAVQAVRDETEKVLNELSTTSKDASQLLAEVRDAAAEQGVTQEAKYFSGEATDHIKSADKWLKASVIMALVVTSYATLSLFFPHLPVFAANTTSEAIQLATSKVLIFFVLAFLLFQCVKNYSAHRHNVVTNKHRQNALMTYTTLAQAGGSREARDVILQHAAAAVYAPNDTGYLKREDRGYGTIPAFGLSSRNAAGSAPSSDG